MKIYSIINLAEHFDHDARIAQDHLIALVNFIDLRSSEKLNATVTSAMATPEEIIAQGKRRQALWKLERKQENEEGADVAVVPDEYNCPICYEEMRGPDRRPTTLFPCGHSVCELCLNEYIRTSGRQKCCLCNTEFKRKAINFSLLHVIENPVRSAQTEANVPERDNCVRVGSINNWNDQAILSKIRVRKR
jgi:hypothetical protein